MSDPAPVSAPAGQLPATEAAGGWLAHVPVPLFAVVMGVEGLGLAWRKASEAFGLPPGIHLALCLFGAACFVAIALLYLAKAVRHPDMVVGELNHPIRSNFFPAISISLLLLAIAAWPGLPLVAEALWWTGALVHIGFTLRILSRWLFRDVQIQHSNPAWFIPIVGNVIVPLAGVRLGYVEISWFFFAVGTVFWVLLFTILLYRIIFHPPLPSRLIPSLFIMLAPPSVAFLSYVLLTDGIDPFARVLVYLVLFLALVLLVTARHFLAVPFAVSWWAFTFPLDAATLATLEYAGRIGSPVLAGIGGVLLVVTTVVVALVLVRTLVALVRGQLFVPE